MADSAHQHDIDAAHEAQDKARLNIWAGIRCPIPSCKRNKPSGTPEPAPSYPTEQSLPIHAGNEYASRLVSGVPHYPPPPSAPPAYTTSSSDPPSPLLDVTVDKVIQLVLGEAERQDKERLANSMMIREPVSPPGDDSSDDDEVVDQGPSTGSVSLTRVASKRRRHRVDQYNRSRVRCMRLALVRSCHHALPTCKLQKNVTDLRRSVRSAYHVRWTIRHVVHSADKTYPASPTSRTMR
jgi:hypothetical protein